MTFYSKLAIFWAVLFGVHWFIRRVPHHQASRVAHSWLGPFPVYGERYSSFLARRASYALKWFGHILLAFCGLWLVVSWVPSLSDAPLFLLFWFSLPLLGGTFLLAASIYAASSAKHHLIGPNPFSLPPTSRHSPN